MYTALLCEAKCIVEGYATDRAVPFLSYRAGDTMLRYIWPFICLSLGCIKKDSLSEINNGRESPAEREPSSNASIPSNSSNATSTDIIVGTIMDQPIILGDINESDIHRTLTQNLDSMTECYQKEYHKNPTIPERIIVKFMILEDGTVPNEQKIDLSPTNVDMASCLDDVFHGMTFANPKGQVIVAQYTFYFTF